MHLPPAKAPANVRTRERIVSARVMKLKWAHAYSAKACGRSAPDAKPHASWESRCPKGNARHGIKGFGRLTRPKENGRSEAKGVALAEVDLERLAAQLTEAALCLFDLFRRQIDAYNMFDASIRPLVQVAPTPAPKVQQPPRPAREGLDQLALHVVVELFELDGWALQIVQRKSGRFCPNRYTGVVGGIGSDRDGGEVRVEAKYCRAICGQDKLPVPAGAWRASASLRELSRAHRNASSSAPLRPSPWPAARGRAAPESARTRGPGRPASPTLAPPRPAT